MVKFFLFAMFIFFQMDAAPLVEASVDGLSAKAHYPLDGIITITHQKEDKIDPHSFTMEGKKLETSFEREVLMSASSDTLVAIYHFQLPAKSAGLYPLPAISVKIGNQVYQTVPSTYEIEEMPIEPTPQAEKEASPLIFRLEAKVMGPTTLYPGERTKLFYRISYNRNVDLTKSDLPMIHPPHFLKVGDVQIQDEQKGNITTQELTQEVEAADPGVFKFGPSTIEGYAYTLKGIQKIYETSLLQAQAPIITLEVNSFPEKGHPFSFTGGIGTITASADLTSSPEVSVGDTLQLQVKVGGISNLDSFRFPQLQCQPGFSGFFHMSDLHPLAEVKGTEKLFQIEIRPTTSLIHAIPAIELSSFNPESGKYVIAKTDPIQIKIEPHPSEKSSHLDAPLIAYSTMKPWPKPGLAPLDFTIQAPKIEREHQRWSPSILWLIPLLIGLLLLQLYFHKKWQQRTRRSKPKSEELFNKGMKLNSLSLLEQALWNRLWEKGMVERGTYPIEQLPEELRSFLFQLQALQFSKDKKFDPKEIKKEALSFFENI